MGMGVLLPPGQHLAVVPAPERLPVVAVLDLAAKAVLLVLLLVIAADPAWGNLEGKAPLARALLYPLIALVVPVLHLVRGREGAYPWLPDLLLTLPGFSDLLGNRLDLYDAVPWFDDAMHFAMTGMIAAAVVLLVVPTGSALTLVGCAVAFGVTAALAWEGWEYLAFVTTSAEARTAYADTLGDLVLGWAGSVCGGLLVSAGSHLPRTS